MSTLEYKVNKYFFTGKGSGYDCVIIDGLSTSKGKPLAFDNFCGLGGLSTKNDQVVAAATDQKTLCCK